MRIGILGSGLIGGNSERRLRLGTALGEARSRKSIPGTWSGSLPARSTGMELRRPPP
jgi:hypothetical protein